MKVIIISVLKLALSVVYLPLKLLKTKNRIVYLSRQSNEKSLDMILLENEIKKQLPNCEQVFRLRMIPDGLAAKIKYCFGVIGDMYYLATSKIAVLDTYSITVSCLTHKKELKVIQIWHALGAIKKFGLQCVGTKEGRDVKISKAMNMHKNYDYILAPSKATAEFYMEAFGYEADKMKICSLPRVDEILTDNGAAVRFYKENPALGLKKIILYLPTFREREPYAAQQLIVEFEDLADEYHLIVSPHPLFSKIKKDNRYSYNGSFSTYDLIRVADYIITDYSACAFEASILMKPLYFFVPDYELYIKERGANIDLKAEMGDAVFEDAAKLFDALKNKEYNQNALYAFKSKYVENTNTNNTEILAKFICMLM